MIATWWLEPSCLQWVLIGCVVLCVDLGEQIACHCLDSNPIQESYKYVRAFVGSLVNCQWFSLCIPVSSYTWVLTTLKWKSLDWSGKQHYSTYSIKFDTYPKVEILKISILISLFCFVILHVFFIVLAFAKYILFSCEVFHNLYYRK